MTTGIAAVKSGHLDQGRRLLHAAARSACMRGTDVLVLACTEIPLVLDEAGAGAPILDATQLLAEATVKHALRGSGVSNS